MDYLNGAVVLQIIIEALATSKNELIAIKPTRSATTPFDSSSFPLPSYTPTVHLTHSSPSSFPSPSTSFSTLPPTSPLMSPLHRLYLYLQQRPWHNLQRHCLQRPLKSLLRRRRLPHTRPPYTLAQSPASKIPETPLSEAMTFPPIQL